MSTTQKTYSQLLAQSKRARLLFGIDYLLEWDQQTYMPSAAAEIRSEHTALIAGLMHKEKTGSRFRNLLNKLIDIKTGEIKSVDLSPAQQTALKEWRRDYLKATLLPMAFVQSLARLQSESMLVWAQARKENRFSLFLPYLEKLVKANQKKAELRGYSEHPYDALIDDFEPDMTSKELSQLFGSMKSELITLLKEITARPPIDTSCLKGEFPAQQQMEFSKKVLAAMGFDFTKGRLDLSTHPFCASLHPYDNRLTTRIQTQNLMDCVSAVLHEGGHSLYDMGLPVEHFGSPLGEHISLGIHESQSRFWEVWIGQSKPFWKHFFPLLQQEFKGQFSSTSLETFYRAINLVQPSFIRVEADEVTYPLHIILRFELEKQLIEGSLKPKEVPEAWNAKMQTLLGITPPTDTLGCLQDIHWSMGAFGYFPTYALGNLYAASFFNTLTQTYPTWEEKVEKGDLIFIKEWLNQKIHCKGKLLSAKNLLKEISGEELSPRHYLAYLKKKYLNL